MFVGNPLIMSIILRFLVNTTVRTARSAVKTAGFMSVGIAVSLILDMAT